MKAEIGIIGGGFAGSLAAMLLRQIGRQVVLLESERHPRFQIGESSTPVADLMIRRFADEYDLPLLEPMSRYGTWKKQLPQLGVGLKRGFSYFAHQPGRHFHIQDEHANELLVAASSRDELGDTHWMRADVDLHLFRIAEEMTTAFEAARVHSLHREGRRWRAEVTRGDIVEDAQFDFVIDATGSGNLFAETLALRDEHARMKTRSRAVYSHFTELPSWSQRLAAESPALSGDHPFDCDDAAQHHLLDEGWLWALRFDHGIASVGFVLDTDRFRIGDRSADEVWSGMMRRYPSLAEELRAAKFADSPGALVQTGRLQRLWSSAAGEGWAMLPTAAGFVDPLHSTGIAHSLFGVGRLVKLLDRHWGRSSLTAQIEEYGQTVVRELEHVDRLVALCYAALPSFERFVDCAMLYFAAATTFEQRIGEADSLSDAGGFLRADDPAFVSMAEELFHAVRRRETTTAQFRDGVRKRLVPYNIAGLCDPNAFNMYKRTAAE